MFGPNICSWGISIEFSFCKFQTCFSWTIDILIERLLLQVNSDLKVVRLLQVWFLPGALVKVRLRLSICNHINHWLLMTDIVVKNYCWSTAQVILFLFLTLLNLVYNWAITYLFIPPEFSTFLDYKFLSFNGNRSVMSRSLMRRRLTTV